MVVITIKKIDKLYINYASTRPLQRHKIVIIECNNQIFPNNSHIHIIACDDASSHHCPSPITGSDIPKRDCILNRCYDCPGINAPDLE